MDNKLNIAIVDDDRSSTFCLHKKLSEMKMAARVDLVSSAEELLEKYLAARHYQIIYLDQLMLGMSGSDAVEKIRKKSLRTRIVFHTSTNDMNEVRKIFQAKPDGWLWKDFMCPDAVISVKTIMDGRHFYSKEADELLQEYMGEKEAEEKRTDGSRKLTERKKEVLILYSKGLPNKEIGNILFISERSVESHMSDFHKDFGLKTRAEMVEYAMKMKIIPRF